MKKLFALILAAAMCLLVAACTPKSPEQGTTDSSTASQTVTTETTTSSSETISTTSTEPTVTDTSANRPNAPVEVAVKNDPVKTKVGSYVTVITNPAYCTFSGSAEKGVGSKETVTLNIKMNDGFTFDGWSVGGAVANGTKPSSTQTTLEMTASAEMTIYANYSVSVKYNANGGTVKGGGSQYTQKYSVVWFKCPVTLPEKGYFTRDGYTLSEYNTKPDGSGTGISLGSRVFMDDKGEIELYCIWEKQNDESDFEFSSSGSGATVTKYKGTSEKVVIPDTLGGKNVTAIASGAFAGTAAKEVILSKNVTFVASGAFSKSDVDTFVFFDSLANIDDGAFDSGKLKNMRVNAALDLYSEWPQNQTTTKLDRFVYASNKGLRKLVIYGGSGSLFGFDCSQIDQATGGKYYVINMGSNAQASSAYYFDWFEDFITDEDIIIWAPEPGSLTYTFGDTLYHNRLWGINSGHYDSLRYVDLSEFTRIFSSYTSYAMAHQTHTTSATDSFPTSYNEYGDYVNSRALVEKARNYSFDLDPSYFYRMQDLMEAVSAKGATVYFNYAAMDKTGYGFDENAINAYTDRIKEAFPSMTVLGDYKASLVEHENMYDSEWHLNEKGADQRTKQLIPILLDQLEKDGK